jgi:hypothetical protein
MLEKMIDRPSSSMVSFDVELLVSLYMQDDIQDDVELESVLLQSENRIKLEPKGKEECESSTPQPSITKERKANEESKTAIPTKVSSEPQKKKQGDQPHYEIRKESLPVRSISLEFQSQKLLRTKSKANNLRSQSYQLYKKFLHYHINQIKSNSMPSMEISSSSMCSVVPSPQ